MNRTYFVALAITILLLATCGTRGVCEERSVPLSTLDCDFDDHNFCHYTNNQYDDFDWTLNSGNTLSSGTGPDADHTTGTTSGFYIYTEASPQNPADKARIDSIKATAPAAGACVRFWYHMYGAGMGTLSVYTGDGKGGLGPSRWSKSGDSGDQWQETWMDIGPGSEFQIVFVGERGSDIESDIAVDDITVVEGQCDSGIKVSDLKCDFDSNTFCAYKNSPNDDFDWLLNRGSTLSSGTGPDVDHTTGNPSGFYIYIEASPQNPGDQARLDAVKATAPASGACVRFWYHMHGAGMGTLSVYTGDDEGGLGPSRWSKSGDSGNVWQEASINICCGHEFQITFIGERGSSTESDMAVDDIIVLEGQCDSNATLSDLNCDFDSNTFCAYKNSPNDDFDWLLNRGSTLSSGTGPDVDHTTGNPSGFYIYIEASPQNPGDQARLDAVRATAPASGACVRFWYHMYGAGMGTLSVYTGDDEGGLGPSRWSKSGDSGVVWQEASINICCGHEFQITLIGERGSSTESDMAVDDIIVSEGQCDSNATLLDLNCDFESNTFCTYKNSPDDDFDWLLNRGSTLSSSTGPDVDHTTGNPSGFYIYTEASPQNPADKARIDSIKATAPAVGACVRFWYHMYGAGMGTLSVYTGDGKGGLGPSRWSKSGDSGDQWQETWMDIGPGSEFQIIFAGERGSGIESDIAVDDITVVEGQCDSGIKVSDLRCDFDSNTFCAYKNSPNDDFDWLLNRGSTLSSGTGPDVDHTTGYPSGFYIYIEASPQNPGDQARLDAVRATAPATGACVRFWYHMHGAGMGTLSVYTGDDEGGLGPSRWSKSGDSGDFWQEASINICCGLEFQITFIGERGSSTESDMAVDDIIVLKGQCDSNATLLDLNCDFDSNTFCAYKNSPNDDFDWLLNRGSTLSSGTGPDVDHTTGNPSGFYIYIEASPQNPGDQARLDAVRATAPATGACVRFWYHMHGAGMGTLSVYTGDDEGGLGPSRWSKSGDSGDFWQEASINICCGLEFQITFIGERGSSTESDMAVDDIIVLKGQCDSNATLLDLNCDFDSNTFCAYKNSPNDDFDWLLNRGSTLSSGTGPDVDHTTGNPSGFYIYIEASPQNPGDQARLDAVKATAPATGACVRFWYHMHGAGMGTLSVYTGDDEGGLGPSRWSKSGDSGDFWQEASINVCLRSEFQITFVGECGRSPTSDIAIDDIIVLEHQCDSTVPLSALNCNFDSGTFCSYNNSQNDDFDWILNSGSTPSYGTGPTADHTTGYSRGFYMYIEASAPRNSGDKARIDSAKATAPATGACVRFWYHMYGGDMGSLTVYTGDCRGGLGPSRWSRKGDSGSLWRETSIDIDPNTEFSITFVGERGISFLSDIAIDDIRVQEGPCDTYIP